VQSLKETLDEIIPVKRAQLQRLVSLENIYAAHRSVIYTTIVENRTLTGAYWRDQGASSGLSLLYARLNARHPA
jgi:hypothetical protein